MLDITRDVKNWVLCCNDVWNKWFASHENSDDEFLEVEEALFSTLVLSNTNLVERPSLNECYTLLRGVYRYDITDERSVCERQKAGNIYCQSKKIIYEKNFSLPINYINFKGDMLNGEPYVELKINDREFILEPLDNLIITIDIN